VVKYRAGRGATVATQDLAAVLTHLQERSGPGRHDGRLFAVAQLGGSTDGGGHRFYGTARFGGPELPKPSALVILYTGHSDLASTEPPTFVAVGDADPIAPPSTMERRVAALRRLGTDVEYRKYWGVGHGFGLGTGTTAEGWIGDALRFWTKQIE
jgi:pimeloyl-ACP methyl ester carboxylesterase